jgi:AcrR family transcriptional regulator
MALKAKAKRRISKRPEERRVDLLDAAAKVFAKKGIAEATVEDITNAAGVAKGTFYLYFDSKEHVLALLKQRIFGEVMTRLGRLPRPTDVKSWWAYSDGVVEETVGFMFENRDLVHLITRELSRHTGAGQFQGGLMDFEMNLLEAFATGLREGMDAGAFRVSDPEVTAVLIHHAIISTVHHALMGAPPMDRGRVLAAAKELVHKTLAP